MVVRPSMILEHREISWQNKEEHIQRVAEGTWASIVVGSEEVMRVVRLEQRRSWCPLVDIWAYVLVGSPAYVW